VTNEISNLLVAGRCASGRFTAQASFRIQPTCMSMGIVAFNLPLSLNIIDLEPATAENPNNK